MSGSQLIHDRRPEALKERKNQILTFLCSWRFKNLVKVYGKHTVYSVFDHDILRHSQSQTKGFDELISMHENWILQSLIYSQMASSGYFMCNTVAKSSTKYHDLGR